MPLPPKDQWLLEFRREVLHLVPELRAGRFLDAIALQEWTLHQADDPAEVAQRWVASRPEAPR